MAMNSPRATAEALKQGLRARGVEVAGLTEEFPGCLELAGRLDGKPFFIYMLRGRFSDSIVCKIQKHPSGCMESLVTPEGLFTIITGGVDGSLIDKLLLKLRVVLTLH